jgi:glucosamine 6-phosphate synthetase-like amidotransferase/phosphosugar isomerase protein
MLDEDEKTAGKFIIFFSLIFLYLVMFFALDDENLNQLLANILQVKERGATVIVITNLTNIYTMIKAEKIDYLI